MKKQVDAWTLYHSMFKEGDEVVVVKEDEDFVWGKIKKAEEKGLRLKTPMKEIYIDWDDIRFMAQDGFPVRRLFGADGSRAIELLNTKDTQKAIRQVLSAIRCPRCDRLVLPSSLGKVKYKAYGGSSDHKRKEYADEERIECKECRSRKPDPRSAYTIFDKDPFAFVYGDPFIVENVSGILINSGNLRTPENWKYEETLLLQSKDGAKGILWGLDTCYYFGK